MPFARTKACVIANPLDGYLPVHVAMLRHVPTAVVDIFVQTDQRRSPTLYCRAGLSLENQQLFGLAEAGVEDVYVRVKDFHDFGAHLLESVESLLEHKVVPSADRFAAMQLAVAIEVEHTVRLID